MRPSLKTFHQNEADKFQLRFDFKRFTNSETIMSM